MYMDTEPSSTGGRNWHYDKPGSAGIGFYQSWYTVAPLVKYLSEVVGCTLTNSKDDLRRGDLAYTPNSSHIVIVSKSLFEDGVFKVCGHTAPVYDGDTPATKFIQMRNSFSASGGHFFRFV
jgi:hypothetical protein